MPPKKSSAAPSKKTEQKKKEKIIEVMDKIGCKFTKIVYDEVIS